MERNTTQKSRRNRMVFGVTATLSLLMLAGCGGSGGGGDDERNRVAGNWRVAEIGTQSGGTQVCPAEVDLGDGLSVSCGGSDTLDLRSDGSFAGTFRDPANPGAAAGTATGTWTYDAGADTAVIAVREIRQDSNGNGQIEQEEITEVDPVLQIEMMIRGQSGDRLTVDLTVDGIFDDAETRYRSVLVRP